uniref:Uncharacterized protein ycf35 n=1 Tax=Digenea simplex TaxID=945030 RepID=A0A1Z1MTM9_DIGSM|nr:hypothetical protein [Digenea simplex]ARW69457.1 hypothetical protein [Digenea simplex]
MSHFSKIKTNISNLDILEKTIIQLGFNCEIIKENTNNSLGKRIVVYKSDQLKDSVFSFVWSGYEYSLIVDLQLWSLKIDVNHFVDLLSQKYAYNVILKQSTSNGFQKVEEEIVDDGSIRLTLQRWSLNYSS